MFMHLSDDALSFRREKAICSGPHLDVEGIYLFLFENFCLKSFSLSQLSSQLHLFKHASKRCIMLAKCDDSNKH